MKGSAPVILFAFVGAIVLTPAHLLADQHHLYEHHAPDGSPAKDHEHRHEQDDSHHDHHWAADHEIVAVRSHEDTSRPVALLAIPVDRAPAGDDRFGARAVSPHAIGPPGPFDATPRPSRAPPLL